MPDEVKETSEEVQREQPAPPVPEISKESEAPSSERSGPDVGALVSKLEGLEAKLSDERLEELIGRRVKSFGDKRLAKADEIYKWVQESGGDVSKIKHEVELADMREQLAAMQEAGGDRGGLSARTPQGKSLQDKTAEFLLKKQDELGITLSDDELESLATGRRYADEADWFGELTTQLVKRAKSGGVTASAAVTQPGSSGPRESGDYVSLAAELAALRGKFDDESNEKRKDLRAQMDALEGDVFSVVEELV